MATSTAQPTEAVTWLLKALSSRFRLPGGTLTTLHSFKLQHHGLPPLRGGLIRASDGHFYGTTNAGGAGVRRYRLQDHDPLVPSPPCIPLTAAPRAAGPRLASSRPAMAISTVRPRLAIGSVASSFASLGASAHWSRPRSGSVSRTATTWPRLDLRAEVFAEGTLVGEGRLDNVTAGGSGFNKAILRTIPARTADPVDFPAPLEIKVSARRTCSVGGHASGVVRLWYDGQPMDSGAQRDPGSRFAAVSAGTAVDRFLRGGFALRTTPGNSRQSIDVRVDTKQMCPSREFTSFGTWSTNP